MSKLIIENTVFSFSRKSINEAIQKTDGRVIVTGPVQRAEEPNHNGRIYPKNILEREVKRFIENRINTHTAVGELDHPDSDTIQLKDGSHKFNKLWWEGNTVMGEVEIMCDIFDKNNRIIRRGTPFGNTAKGLLDCGVTLGISSRGMGSVKESKGSSIIQDDFDLLTWDLVSDPSTKNAFMKLNEDSNNKLNPYNLLNTTLDSIFKLV